MNVAGWGNLVEGVAVIREVSQAYTCKEQRAALTVVNDGHAPIAFVRLDGGFFPEGNACDFAVSSCQAPFAGFILELKGCHADHAVAQLSTTLQRLKTGRGQFICRSAVVVSSGTKMPGHLWQKLVRTFRSRHGMRLERCSNRERVGFSRYGA